MQTRVVLVSDDADFFEYMTQIIELRKNDEMYRFSFVDIPDKLDIIASSLVIINGEKSAKETLELLSLIKGTPSIVFSYNDDEEFKINCCKAGCFAYLTLLSSKDEIKSRISVGLENLSKIQKNKMYRDILVNNKIVTPHNEVYLEYTSLLDNELKRIEQEAASSVLAAISPDEKSKFFIRSNQIETLVLNNIRKNDILMNFAPNKYFLLLNNTNLEGAKKIWNKIQKSLPEKIYAGFASTGGKNRGQLVNEALNKLHEELNKSSKLADKDSYKSETNFKIFRNEFYKKFEQIINPVFYHAIQKYGEKYLGISINNEVKDGCGYLYLKSRYKNASLKVTSPGCTKINIDINDAQNENNRLAQEKRITLNIDEFESGVLEDIVERFIIEFKKEVENEHT